MEKRKCHIFEILENVKDKKKKKTGRWDAMIMAEKNCNECLNYYSGVENKIFTLERQEKKDGEELLHELNIIDEEIAHIVCVDSVIRFSRYILSTIQNWTANEELLDVLAKQALRQKATNTIDDARLLIYWQIGEISYLLEEVEAKREEILHQHHLLTQKIIPKIRQEVLKIG